MDRQDLKLEEFIIPEAISLPFHGLDFGVVDALKPFWKRLRREDPWTILAVGAVRDDEACRALLEGFSFADPDSWGLPSVPRLPKSHSVAILKEQLGRHPSAETHYKLVVGLNKFGSQAEAESELCKAAARYPEDFRCQLAMACLLIKKNALAEAGQYISHMARLRQRGTPSGLWRDSVFAQAVYLSLTGQAAVGRSWVRQLCERDPKDKRTKQALEAFEDVPVMPASCSGGGGWPTPLRGFAPPSAVGLPSVASPSTSAGKR